MHVNELAASRSDLNTLCFIFPAEGSPPTRSGMYLGPGQPKRICSGSACQKNTKMVHIVQSGAYLPFEAYSPQRPLKLSPPSGAMTASQKLCGLMIDPAVANGRPYLVASSWCFLWTENAFSLPVFTAMFTNPQKT